MPNRILRDWTDSERINALSIEAERFFTRLIMKADDYGCFSANPKLLSSLLFPLIGNITEDDILKWLDECSFQDLIIRYSDSNKSYLQINDFRQRVRNMTSKYPLPDTCQTDDRQLTVNCQTDDGVKRSRNEVEVETKRNEVEVPDNDSKIFINASNQTLKDRFFTDENTEPRNEIMKMLSLSDVELKNWSDKFNSHLTIEAKKHQTLNEWRRHFSSWLRIQIEKQKNKPQNGTGRAKTGTANKQHDYSAYKRPAHTPTTEG